MIETKSNLAYSMPASDVYQALASRPTRKSSGAVTNGNLSRLEMPNRLFAGTNVASGTEKAVVVATGMQSELGMIFPIMRLNCPACSINAGS
jgi:magnesium-transporting ATPase (P-type)